MRENVAGDCHVYLIAHKDAQGEFVSPIKVGITKSLASRVAALQTGNPRPIALVFAFVTPATQFARHFEGAFHGINAGSRMSGEWFDMEPRDALFKLIVYAWSSLVHELGRDEELVQEAMEMCGVNRAIAALDSVPWNERCEYGKAPTLQ